MPTLKGQEINLVVTVLLASAPLSRPLLSPTAPPPHSKALPTGMLSTRSCSIAGIVALSSVAWQPRESVSLVRAEEGQAAGAQGRTTAQEWVVSGQASCHARSPKGQAEQGWWGCCRHCQVPYALPLHVETRLGVEQQGVVGTVAIESAKQCKAFHLQMLDAQGAICSP